MSLFFDQTKDVEEAQKLVDQATIDEATNLSTYALNHR